MIFASFISDDESTAAAAEEIRARAEARQINPDLVFVFFTGHHSDQAETFLDQFREGLDADIVLGCSAEGVIGEDREIEREPGISVLMAQLPGVRLDPFHISRDEWEGVLGDPTELAARLTIRDDTRGFVGFGDPFTTPIDPFLQALDAAAPGAPLIGGMASAARSAGENALVYNDEIVTDGFIGVSLSGPIAIDTIVSQGCRPVGAPMVVTKSQKNIIEQLGGRPALHALREMVESLRPEDKALLSHGLLIGRAISEYRDSFGRGDFLVRNLMGVDQASGAIAVADYVRVGQTVQFHVRDAETAGEDLNALLDPHRAVRDAGALLFSCNGRGTRMFSHPCHDVSAARSAMPNVPLAGFFAAGELGPVGGRNFIHGHTASFAILREASG